MATSPLEKTVEMAHLFDAYAGLLTERQRQVVDLYHHKDLSLGEIAAAFDVTRQAVHDVLRRAEESLRRYEQVLGLAAERRQDRRRRRRWARELAAIHSRLAGTLPEGAAPQKVLQRVRRLQSRIIEPDDTGDQGDHPC